MVVCIRIEVSTFIMLNLFFQICNVVLNLLYDSRICFSLFFNVNCCLFFSNWSLKNLSLVPYESAIFVSFNKVVINKKTGCNILQWVFLQMLIYGTNEKVIVSNKGLAAFSAKKTDMFFIMGNQRFS